MTGTGERAVVGTTERALLAGGVTVAAHLVLIGVLGAFAPSRETPAPARVDFEMARVPELPAVVAAPAEPAAAAAGEPMAAKPAEPVAAKPRRSARVEAALLSEEARNTALLRVLASEGGSDVNIGILAAREGSVSDVLAGTDIGTVSELRQGGGGTLVRGAGDAGGGLRTGTARRGDIGAGPGTQPAPEPGVDREAIRKAVQAKVRYPRQAEEMGLEGTVMVEFRIDEVGEAKDLRVTRSVDASLDDAAREAVELAAPFKSPPGRVRVPVRFTLPAP